MAADDVLRLGAWGMRKNHERFGGISDDKNNYARSSGTSILDTIHSVCESQMRKEMGVGSSLVGALRRAVELHSFAGDAPFRTVMSGEGRAIDPNKHFKSRRQRKVQTLTHDTLYNVRTMGSQRYFRDLFCDSISTASSHQPCRYLIALRSVCMGQARSTAWGKTVRSADRRVPPSGG